MRGESGTFAIKQVSDNAINIIQTAILEYPICLNFTYCEHFLTTIRDRVDSLTMYIHALCHAESSNDVGIYKNYRVEKIHSIAKRLAYSLLQLPDYALALQKRAELTVPLLSAISQKLYVICFNIR